MKNKKNSFIYNENANIGRLLMVEGEDNTTKVYKLKEDNEPICTIDVPWWDLNNIKRAVKKNETEIIKAVNLKVIDGVNGEIQRLKEKINRLPIEDRRNAIDELKKLL